MRPSCDHRPITSRERPVREGFVDRRQAGRALATPVAAAIERLRREGDEPEPVVLGLARGGVVVAFEVARCLELPLDVLVASKVGAPGNPELGIGAVAEGGAFVVGEEIVRRLRIGREQLERRIEATRTRVRERVDSYRRGAEPVDLRGRIAVIVDDGLATGGTALAAIHDARSRGARAVICTVPVGASSTAQELREEADDVVCLLEPEPMRAIGIWYEDFTQVSDTEVLELLAEARCR